MWLEVKDIRVHYGRVEALKGVSLGMEPGMIITLIGANGAGKTTTVRSISGLKAPTQGEIRFEDKRIDRLSPVDIVRRGIAQVPEGRRLFPEMTVLENLKMGAYLRNNAKEINQDLEIVYHHFPVLKERKAQQAGSLSGGEQQMLAIGRALMARPKLLLLDEPSLGLAPKLVEEIGRIVLEINQRGVSVLLVEQNAQLALRLAHRGYVLETGKVVLEGDTKELARNEQVRKAYLGA